MAGEDASTLRAQWLGQKLREMRERAKLTLRDVGDYINRNPSTVSRVESGLLPARVPEVLAYLDICGIDDPRRRADLKLMSQEVFRKGWWQGYVGEVAATLIDWIWLESRATEIRHFQSSVLPGMLQTRDYAEAVIRAEDPEASEEQIERWVELRMDRQRRLDAGEPFRLAAVLDEAVLRRQVGGPTVMREQLAHLATLVGRAAVELRVLPYEAGAHASPDGGFEVLAMPSPYPAVGIVFTPAGTLFVEQGEADRLAERYDQLRDAARNPDATLAFLSDLIARLE